MRYTISAVVYDEKTGRKVGGKFTVDNLDAVPVAFVDAGLACFTALEGDV